MGGWCVARQPPAHFRTLLIHALSAGTSRLVRMEPSSVSNLDAASFGGVGVGVPPMPPSTGGRAAQLACFYAAPCTKFVLRMVCYQLFLVLYAGVLIFDDGTPDFDMVEVAFYAFAVGYAFDELHQLIEAWDSGRSHFDDEGARAAASGVSGGHVRGRRRFEAGGGAWIRGRNISVMQQRCGGLSARRLLRPCGHR